MALQYSKDLYGKTFAEAYVRISQIRTRQDVLQTEETTEKIIVGECLFALPILATMGDHTGFAPTPLLHI